VPRVGGAKAQGSPPKTAPKIEAPLRKAIGDLRLHPTHERRSGGVTGGTKKEKNLEKKLEMVNWGEARLTRVFFLWVEPKGIGIRGKRRNP